MLLLASESHTTAHTAHTVLGFRKRNTLVLSNNVVVLPSSLMFVGRAPQRRINNVESLMFAEEASTNINYRMSAETQTEHEDGSIIIVFM